MADDETKELSLLKKHDKLKKAKELAHYAISADAEWQSEAEIDHRFKASGHQWTDEEKSILDEEGRPAYEFNYIKSHHDLVMGVAIQNRVKLSPEPVEKTDQFLCDVIQSLVDHVDETTNSEREEFESFSDCITTGRGYAAIDIQADPKRFGEIKFIIQNVPVHEIRLDPATTRDDLGDSSRIFRYKWVNRVDFKVMYPKFADRIDELMDSEGSMIDDFSSNQQDDDILDDTASYGDGNYYKNAYGAFAYDKSKDAVRVTHMEYWEPFQRYYGYNPANGKIEEFQQDQLEELKERVYALTGQELEYETVSDKKIKWLQFIDDEILYDGDSPVPYDGFSICPVFCYKDKSGKRVTHFGICRLLRDPQREINKRWSQALYQLINQGHGLIAEKDAVEDWREAQDAWNDPSRIVFVEPGALEGGKLKEIKANTFPDAAMKMEEFAKNSIKEIGGINPDLMGVSAGRSEPGVVVQLRQQQGLTLLAPVFENFKEFRRELYKRKIAFILHYMPDSQILNILGETDRYAIQGDMIVDKQYNMQANIRDLRNVKYNVKIEEAPGNLTKQMFELQMFMELQAKGFPVPPKAIIDRFNLSAGDKTEMLNYIEGQQKMQQEQLQMQANSAMAEAKARNDLEQAKLQLQKEQTMLKHQSGLVKEQQKHKVSLAKLALEKAQQRLEQIEIRNNMMIEMMKINTDKFLTLKQVGQKERDSKRDYAADIQRIESNERRQIT